MGPKSLIHARHNRCPRAGSGSRKNQSDALLKAGDPAGLKTQVDQAEAVMAELEHLGGALGIQLGEYLAEKGDVISRGNAGSYSGLRERLHPFRAM